MGTVGGWVRQRCHVSCITGASNWYWLTVGQGFLHVTSQQVRVEGTVFISSVSLLSFIFLFLSCLFLSFPRLSLLSLFSLSMGDDTKWPSRVDVSLNTQHNQNLMVTAPALFNQNSSIFLICPWKHTLWVLIRRTSLRYFYEYPQHTFMEV